MYKADQKRVGLGIVATALAIGLGGCGVGVGGVGMGGGAPTGGLNQALSDSVSASGVTVTFSGPDAVGGYSFSSTAGYAESGSTYVWNRASSSSGPATTSNIGTSKSYALQNDDDKQYLQFCVTPKDNQGTTGAQVCSSWTYVGHLFGLWDQDNYYGNSVHFAYENAGNGFCWNLNNYGFGSKAESAVLYPINSISGNTTLILYNDDNCGGGTYTSGSYGSWQNWGGWSFCTYANCSDQPQSAMVIWNDSVSATNVGISMGIASATGTYTFDDGDGAGDESSYVWYRSASSAGTSATEIDTNKTHTWANADDNAYVQFCVTPSNGVNSGTQVCSAWTSVGPVLSLYKDSGYSGTSLFFAYSQGTSKQCVNLTDYNFNDMLSSFYFTAMASHTTDVKFFQDTNCGGTGWVSLSLSAGASNGEDVPSGDNDSMSSFMMIWDDTVSASNVALTFEGDSVKGSYTFSDSDGFSEDGTVYEIDRADDGTGTNTVQLTTSESWTLTTDDNERYLRFCVTPKSQVQGGSQVCSSWQHVNRLIELWQNSGYGGSNINIAYHKYASGTCFNLTDYGFNDEVSSLKVYGTTNYTYTFYVYSDINCSGNVASVSMAAGAELDSSYVNDTFGSGWNDVISSVKIVW